jgi:hypothetical protein
VEGIGCERGSWAVPLLGGPGPFRLFPSAMKKSRPIRRRFFLEFQGLAPSINQKSTKYLITAQQMVMPSENSLESQFQQPLKRRYLLLKQTKIPELKLPKKETNYCSRTRTCRHSNKLHVSTIKNILAGASCVSSLNTIVFPLTPNHSIYFQRSHSI